MIRTAAHLAAGNVNGFIERLASFSGALQGGFRTAEARESLAMFSDYLGALTLDDVGKGHGKAYYAKYGPTASGLLNAGQGTEMVANYWALVGSSKREMKAFVTLLKELAPKTWRAIEAEVERAAHG